MPTHKHSEGLEILQMAIFRNNKLFSSQKILPCEDSIQRMTQTTEEPQEHQYSCGFASPDPPFDFSFKHTTQLKGSSSGNKGAKMSF